MLNSVQAFRPTLILAAESDKILMSEADENEIPVLTFKEDAVD
jgi:hypothetical protein